MRFYDKIDRVIKQSFFFDETVVDNKTAETVLVDLLEKNSSIWSVFRHSFKRSFLEENEIKFNASYKSAEDCDFFIKAILAAKSFHATRIPFCYYRIDRPGSTMTDLKGTVVINNFEVSKKWYEYFRGEYYKNSSVCSEKLMHFFANMYCDSIAMIGALNSFDRKKLIYKRNIDKDILRMVEGHKHKIAVLIYSVLGKKMGCIILSKLYKLNRVFKVLLCDNIKCFYNKKGY